jgi:hypothetical protein
MGLKGPRLGRETSLRACGFDSGMQLLQSFDIPLDPAPDHARVAQVGKPPDSVKPQREAELGRDGAAKPVNQKWDGGGTHFAQEFQGQVDVVDGGPAYIGARVAQRMLKPIEDLFAVVGYRYCDERPHSLPARRKQKPAQATEGKECGALAD